MRFSWRFLADVILPAFFMCWIAYFSYDAIASATGLRALRDLEAKAAEKEAEVAALTAERRRLEIVARQLNPRSLDPDMAEEKIRTVLGFVEEGDIVIPRRELEALLKQAETAKAGG